MFVSSVCVLTAKRDRFAPDGPLFLRDAGMFSCLVVFTVDGYLKLFLEAGTSVAIHVLFI